MESKTLEDLLIDAEIYADNNGQTFNVEGAYINEKGKLIVCILPKQEPEEDYEY